MTDYIIVPLDKNTHDRAAFTCGVGFLDQYLKERAYQDLQKHISVTYVLTTSSAESTIIGFYTLSTMAINMLALPDLLTRKLPKYPMFPAILIGRLAVAEPFQGKGFGARLLVSALTRCLGISEQIGVLAVLVDAKDEEAASFYRRYGFASLEEQPFTMFLTMQQIKNVFGSQLFE